MHRRAHHSRLPQLKESSGAKRGETGTFGMMKVKHKGHKTNTQ